MEPQVIFIPKNSTVGIGVIWENEYTAVFWHYKLHIFDISICNSAFVFAADTAADIPCNDINFAVAVNR